MANRNYYPNLPGVRSVFNDGQLSQTTENTQGRALFLGAAKQGPSFRKVSISNFSNALNAFKGSELMDQVLGSIRAGNESIRVERVGGRQTHHLLKKDIQDSIEQQTLLSVSLIERLAEDSEELAKYYLALLPYKDGNIYRQRVLGLYFDSARASSARIVYDSEMIMAQDAGLFEIEINVPNGAAHLLHTGDAFSVPADSGGSAAAYDSIVRTIRIDASQIDHLIPLGANFTITDSRVTDLSGNAVNNVPGSGYTYEVIGGDSGESLNHCERYANYEMAYEELEYSDMDFLVPEGCFVDILPFDLSSATIDTAKQYADYNLGYFWKFVYRGRPYMFMFGRPSPFEHTNVDQGGFTQSLAGHNIGFNISADQAKLGDLLNLVHFYFKDDAGLANPGDTKLEIFPDEKGIIQVHIDYRSNPGNALTVNTPFATVIIPDGMNVAEGNMRLRASKSLCEAAGAADRTLAESLLAGGYNSDPFVLTHYDLTGELIPEEVLDRLFSYNDLNLSEAVKLEAADAEVREVNLGHQAAQAAYKASASYSQTVAFAQLTKPAASRNGVSDWAGKAPTYEVNTEGDITVSENGTGIMANKLMFGDKDYRNGSAYGGFICTRGDALPNEEPYGIDHNDEAVDQFGNPIDIGKHLIIVGAYALATSSESIKLDQSKVKAPRAQAKVKNISAEVAGRLASLRPDEEPIGPVNGIISGVSPINQRIPKSVLNNLALGRVVMLDENGAIASMRTAALPTSDFTRVSTIRAANEVLTRIRKLELPLRGKNIRNAKDSLNTDILGMMRALGQEGTIQPATGVAQIIQSRADEIAGRMRILVSFTPPFALEQITVDLTLTPPA